MRMYAQFDHYVPCGSRVMNIFTYDDSHSDYNAHRMGRAITIFPHGETM